MNEFEWDARKADANLKKHGIGFEDALTVFADPLAKIFADPDHSADERRELIIGHSAGQQQRVRLIGARTATAAERKRYEENLKAESER